MDNQFQQMPEPVAAAVNAVMGAGMKLPKQERNQHGGYMFASVDAFLAAMNPLCADAGLIITQDEISVEMVPGKKDTPWLKIVFSFGLHHKSGVSWEHQTRRTIMVPANGAQAFGSAESYALKRFMRSLFQIATGDKDDADFSKADPLPSDQGRARTAESARSDGASTPDEPSKARTGGSTRQITLMNPADGSAKMFPYRQSGALSAMAWLEDMCRQDNGADCWECNWSAMAEIVEKLPQLQADPEGAPDGPTLGMRMDALREQFGTRQAAE